MARPFPWLPRLSRIRGTVTNSVRSHYSRRDLELLFGISERAAGRLLELLATEPIGTSHLVNKDVLAGFLERVASSKDVPGVLHQVRAERENLSRVKARFLLPRDELEVPVASLPPAIALEPGRVSIAFESLEQLCERLVQLSQAMKDDPVSFEARCEPRKPVRSAEAEDARYIQNEIERMESDRKANRLVMAQ